MNWYQFHINPALQSESAMQPETAMQPDDQRPEPAASLAAEDSLAKIDFDGQFLNPDVFLARFQNVDSGKIDNMRFYHLSHVKPGSADIHFMLEGGSSIDLLGVNAEHDTRLDPGMLRAAITSGSSLMNPSLEPDGHLTIIFATPTLELRLHCHTARIDFADPHAAE